MSSSSESATSPEVITLDESAQEIIELDRYKPNPEQPETIDISNETLPPGDDSIKILEPTRIPNLDTQDTVQEETSVSSPKSPKNDQEQTVTPTPENDDRDSGAKPSSQNKDEDSDVKPLLKKSDQNDSVKTSPKSNNQDPSTIPLVKVVFKDEAMFQKNIKKIESFLKMLLIPDVGKNMRCLVKDSMLEIFEPPESSSCIRLKRTLPLEKELSSSSNEALFTLDIAPNTSEDIDIPKYGKKSKKALEKTADEIQDEAKNDACPKLTCFNCLGNHNLRDCDQPKNYSVINKNRKEFASKKGPAVSRYHLEDDQKYDHFIPGQLSENLCKALGMKENSLPKYIYRMRHLGYPPGWMEAARLQHSGLTLFNSEGLAEGGSDEEGEIVNPGDKDKYDMNKIIDFPGFNVPTPEGVHDEEFEFYWGSQAQQNNSKEAMLSYFSSKKADDGYKRKKLRNPANTVVRTNINPGEMDLDEVEETPVECLPTEGLFIPPLPKDNIPPPPPPDDLADSDNQSQEDASAIPNDDSMAQVSRDNSPSLVDLENQKFELLAELKGSPSPGQKSLQEVNNKDESLVEESESSDSAKTEDSTKSNVNSGTPKTPSNGIAKKSTISVHVGTPILHSVSPFKRLPNSEKFSKNICDVINFENLPDSTGKYDQMTELLQKVRSTLRKE